MDTVKQLMKEAHALWRAGKELDMIDYLQKAIHLSKQENNHHQLMEILNEYGGALRNAGRYDEAIEAVKEAITIYQQSSLQQPLAYATMVLNLGNNYREKGDYYEGEKRLLEAKDLFDKLQDRSYAYIGLLNNLALLYQQTKEFTKAKDLQLEAIHLLEATDYAVPLAISYNNLYEIYKHLPGASLEEAYGYLQKSEFILLREVGKEHPLYAAVLNNKADYAVITKNYEQARKLYREALPIVKHCYGIDSDAYRSVESNINKVNDIVETLAIPAAPLRISGLERARLWSSEVAQHIELNFPALTPRLCLALVGTGSECLGYDDDISEDHDFTTRCQIFLDSKDYTDYGEPLRQYFSTITKGKVQVMLISQFYRAYTLYEKGPYSLYEYRRVPQDLLRTATNGEVFLDNLGLFTSIRNRLLNYYPEDIRLRKIAFCLNKMAQSGQYNLPRMLNRGDLVAAELARAEFIKYYLDLIHLLNKVYAPFYKWLFKSSTTLTILGNTTKRLIPKLIEESLADAPKTIETLVLEVIRHLHQEHLSTSSIDFLTYQASEVVKHIQNKSLREEDSWVE